jgi:hypothetical protein
LNLLLGSKRGGLGDTLRPQRQTRLD